MWKAFVVSPNQAWVLKMLNAGHALRYHGQSPPLVRIVGGERVSLTTFQALRVRGWIECASGAGYTEQQWRISADGRRALAVGGRNWPSELSRPPSR